MNAIHSAAHAKGGAVRITKPSREESERDLLLLQKAVQSSIQGALDWEADVQVARIREDADTRLIKEKAATMERLFGGVGAQTLDLKVDWGDQFVVPAYDEWWATGSGMPWAHTDGSMMVVGADGFSASGFGIYLESDDSGIVSVSPQGLSNSSWVSFEHLPNIRSKAGAGVVVYDGTTLLVSRQPILWDVKGAGRFEGRNFKLPYGAIATPPYPGSFGTVPLAPVLAPIQPGSRLLVWFYLWHLGQNMSGRVPFLAMLSAKIPLVTVAFGKGPIVN